jgi:hypothetical protein
VSIVTSTTGDWDGITTSRFGITDAVVTVVRSRTIKRVARMAVALIVTHIFQRTKVPISIARGVEHGNRVVHTQSSRVVTAVFGTIIAVITDAFITNTHGFITEIARSTRITIITRAVLGLVLQQTSISTDITDDVLTLRMSHTATISIDITRNEMGITAFIN